MRGLLRFTSTTASKRLLIITLLFLSELNESSFIIWFNVKCENLNFFNKFPNFLFFLVSFFNRADDLFTWALFAQCNLNWTHNFILKSLMKIWIEFIISKMSWPVNCRSWEWCDDLWCSIFNFNGCWSCDDTEILSRCLFLFRISHSIVHKLLLRKSSFCCGMKYYQIYCDIIRVITLWTFFFFRVKIFVSMHTFRIGKILVNIRHTFKTL